jgi:hypothetical protein
MARSRLSHRQSKWLAVIGAHCSKPAQHIAQSERSMTHGVLTIGRHLGGTARQISAAFRTLWLKNGIVTKTPLAAR